MNIQATTLITNSCSIESFDSCIESHYQRKNNKKKYGKHILQGLSKFATILQQNIFLISNHLTKYCGVAYLFENSGET